jgi:hypothetical protein
MKKLLLTLCAGLLLTVEVKSQEFFGSATNKSADGYLTGGYIKHGWGAFLGFNYKEQSLIQTSTGSFGSTMKVGIIRVFPGERIMLGVGVQPQGETTKPNIFVGYNFVKSTDLKIWAIGNIVGSTFAPGVGLTYKLEKITF